MNKKIAVTDACIFIDLFDLGLIDSFFELEIEIHTTVSVIFELFTEQQQNLQAYQSADRLIVHNLQEHDYLEIFSQDYPKSLSETDKSVLHIAKKINACILSSDKTLRNWAKNNEIEYHGMIWIFDKLVESSILTKKDGIIKLRQLVAGNIIFRNNDPLVVEIEKRLNQWK
jgi:rRNA-processing protein FCF1